MAQPTLNDFLAGSGLWHGNHKGIRFELSWHGKSDYMPQGTWCWYLHLNSEMFYAEDWAKLRLEKEDKEFAGSFRRHFVYDNFPDLDAHGGWTFGEMDTYLGKDGSEYEHVKVGCDYAHLWDRESNYCDGRADIERDAKRSIDLLCEQFPRRRVRCSYSGRFDDAEQFYTARNGSVVHKSFAEQFTAEHWPLWMPADAQAA